MESIIGGMVSVICYLFSGIATVDTFLELGSEYVIKTSTRLNHNYFACKKSLQDRYPNYETEL